MRVWGGAGFALAPPCNVFELMLASISDLWAGVPSEALASFLLFALVCVGCKCWEALRGRLDKVP